MSAIPPPPTLPVGRCGGWPLPGMGMEISKLVEAAEQYRKAVTEASAIWAELAEVDARAAALNTRHTELSELIMGFRAKLLALAEGGE